MTTEDFLRPKKSCAEELAPLKLVAFASPGRPPHYARQEVNPPVASETGNPLRSMAPVALLACLKGMYCSGRLTAAILASLALQFLPILAQRVSRKQEKINRKGPKLRKGPILQLLRRLCEQLKSIPDSQRACEALQGYIGGTDTGHLGDGLAELLKVLAACKSRILLASALVAVADEVLQVLPFLFPESFGPASPNPCGAVAAAVVGAPVHGGFACAMCHADPIVGPRFEVAGRKASLCGECFMKDSLLGNSEERDFSCRLAPKDYDPEAALDLSQGALDAPIFLSQPSGMFPCPLLDESALSLPPWPLEPTMQIAQMMNSTTLKSAALAGLSTFLNERTGASECFRGC